MATTEQVLVAIRDLLALCAGVQAAYIGIPENPAKQTIASVSVLDGPPPGRMTIGQLGWDQNFLLLWESTVQGDEEGRERALAQFKDDLRTRWLAARKSGTLVGARWDDTLAASPEYRPRLGQETRAYASVMTVPQTVNLTLP
jgi:hypothetical protein